MKQKTSPFDYLHSLDRYRFLTVLNAANECKEYQFSKQAILLWLVNYPGDLYVQYYQALMLTNLGKENQAKDQLKSLISFDPAFIEPIQLLQELTASADSRKPYDDILAYFNSTKSGC